MRSLAIVIPAYKSAYLSNALESICSQTCKDFNLYIGDDNSPEDLQSIVKKWSIDRCFYHKFDENLGGKNLVAHWNRCISLIQDEEWVWLFSDDDIMGQNCVEKFYETLSVDDSYDLYHFDVVPIDAKGEKLYNKRFQKKKYPRLLESKEYVRKRLQFQINSFVVEYIFRRKTFEVCGEFQAFDMAWGADDATWAKISLNKGIYTIENAFVYWRFSGVNITSVESALVMKRKGGAVVNLLSFYDSLYNDFHMRKWYFYYFLHVLYNMMKSCEWNDIKTIMKEYRRYTGINLPLLLIFLIYKLVKK